MVSPVRHKEPDLKLPPRYEVTARAPGADMPHSVMRARKLDEARALAKALLRDAPTHFVDIRHLTSRPVGSIVRYRQLGDGRLAVASRRVFSPTDQQDVGYDADH